jgi:hypothetical protein
MTIAIKPTASGSTIEQNGSTILTVDGSGNITPSNDLYPKVPAFSAYLSSNQSISNATWTKIQHNAEEFDLTSEFNTSTYTFTPTVAGYYQINAAITFAYTAAADKAFLIYISKNGSVAKYGSKGSSTGIVYPGATVNCLIYLNGTTDYIDCFGYQNTGGSQLAVGLQSDTYFQAHLVSV